MDIVALAVATTFIPTGFFLAAWGMDTQMGFAFILASFLMVVM
jgi:hypothetical protein